jgi:hypothetical protein
LEADGRHSKKRGFEDKRNKNRLNVRRKGFGEKAEKIYRGSHRNVSIR